MRLSTARSISVGKVVIIESIINQTSLDSADYKKGVGDRLWDSNINIEVLDTMSEYSLPQPSTHNCKQTCYGYSWLSVRLQ